MLQLGWKEHIKFQCLLQTTRNNQEYREIQLEQIYRHTQLFRKNSGMAVVG